MSNQANLKAILPWLACLSLSACGGGGGGGSETITIEFSQTSNCTGSEPNLVSLSLGTVDQSAGTFQLVVGATLSDSTVGAAFHLSFDRNVLKFESFVPDPAFQGLNGFAQAAGLPDKPGTVAVGVSRPGGSTGVSGNVEIGRVVLRRVTDEGLSAVAISQDFLADAASSFPSPLAACWGGGQVRIKKQ